jgi:hypothetical protein
MDNSYREVVSWMDTEMATSGSSYPGEPDERADALAFAAALHFGHFEWFDAAGHWIKRASYRAVSGKQS